MQNPSPGLKIKDEDAKNHATLLILYHLTFVCTYRKKLLMLYGEESAQVFEEIASPSDVSFETVEGDQDRIHWLVKSEPRISPLAIVRLWTGRTFRSDGYFCYTISNASQETIRRDIESQG